MISSAATAIEDQESLGGQMTESVKEYYGKVLETKNDLKTTACCTTDSYPEYLKSILSEIHDEVLQKDYGCGVPIPVGLEGCTALDLGCGAGRDPFILSKLVGPEGKVIGVDMTDEQLAVANKHRDYHAKQWGHDTSNVTFVKGYMEELETAGIADESVDLVVSNCVFNLSPRKEQLFREVLRVLKPGGELYFSDVFSDRRLTDAHRADPTLLGECLGGAMYIEDFRRLMRDLGVADYRTMSSTPITITDQDVLERIGNAKFGSITIRLFKLPLEDQCEDYGQAAVYNGGIAGSEHAFTLDDHHHFEVGRLMTVCGNTADMLGQTRFAKHFTIHGDKSTHYGLFPCGPTDVNPPLPNGSCC